MAGDTSLGENYAFAGMYHIFDQHAESGKHGIIMMIVFFVCVFWLDNNLKCGSLMVCVSNVITS